MNAMTEVSTLRLYLLRTLYLLIFIGQGFLQIPTLIHPTHPWTLWRGVGCCMLAALALLSALGIRYPLQMLPLLLFEMLWKTLWLAAIAFPMWSANQWDPGSRESLPSILMVVIVPIVIPWPYIFANYVKRSGDRWK
jgi:hypothetical protein